MEVSVRLRSIWGLGPTRRASMRVSQMTLIWTLSRLTYSRHALLKQHGLVEGPSELGADFSHLMLPKPFVHQIRLT